MINQILALQFTIILLSNEHKQNTVRKFLKHTNLRRKISIFLANTSRASNFDSTFFEA